MNILSNGIMTALFGIRQNQLCFAGVGDFDPYLMYGCRNACSGACEGDCSGSCDNSCTGGCAGTFGYD